MQPTREDLIEMNLGIIGYGFVGNAHGDLLKGSYNIIVSDPPKDHHIGDRKLDAAIVCVSTPEAEDGRCNFSNVISALRDLPNEIPVLIKSTISIEAWDLIQETFPEKRITFSPEYLRAETAAEDMKSAKVFHVGGADPDFWWEIFQEVWPDAVCTIASPKALILNKYSRNSFLALKVSFVNQLGELCKALGVSSDEVSSLFGSDPRIGTSHIEITERKGWGGYCFPKDTSAIVTTAEENNVDFSLIKEARRYNNSIRKY
tara:strand:+ start:988 stop:1767 length:780 start_codon:yes stop_codon:yes gene_type:complete